VAQTGITTVTILVVDTGWQSFTTQGRVVGCRDVRVSVPRSNVVSATPLGPLEGCSGLVQTY
jgi:hypothetical protein